MHNVICRVSVCRISIRICKSKTEEEILWNEVNGKIAHRAPRQHNNKEIVGQLPAIACMLQFLNSRWHFRQFFVFHQPQNLRCPIPYYEYRGDTSEHSNFVFVFFHFLQSKESETTGGRRRSTHFILFFAVLYRFLQKPQWTQLCWIELTTGQQN